MNNKLKNTIEEFIEHYGEDEIDRYIDMHDFNSEDDVIIPLKDSNDLYTLTSENFDLFKADYKEYLDNISLNEDDRRGYEDIVENINKD